MLTAFFHWFPVHPKVVKYENIKQLLSVHRAGKAAFIWCQSISRNLVIKAIFAFDFKAEKNKKNGLTAQHCG